MKFLVAPNAFKGTLTAQVAASEISKVIKEYYPKAIIKNQPIADGGDGTCSLLIESLGLEKIYSLTLNPIGQPVLGYFGWDETNKRAFLDVSTASGIGLLKPEQLQPDLTSTFGTGLLIKRAIEMGAEEVLLGLGGSATVDLGIGILQALGVLFLDNKGREIIPFSPGFMSRVFHIQLTPNLAEIKFTLLCDVKNPLLGENGAVKVFGPQKGIKPVNLEGFENELSRVLNLLIKKRNHVWEEKDGFGAAGGIAAGLSFFFPTKIEFGAAYYFELVGLKDLMEGVDWVITGEGKYDSQSSQGKACFELLNLSKRLNIKTALITSGNEARGEGFDLIIELPPIDFKDQYFKTIAEENFRQVLKSAIESNLFC